MKEIEEKLKELLHSKWLCEYWIKQSKEDIKNGDVNLRGAKIVFEENAKNLYEINEQIKILEKCVEIIK